MTTLDDLLRGIPPDQVHQFAASLSPTERAALAARIEGIIGKPDPLAGVGWREWNRRCVPGHVADEYAPFHAIFWEWVDRIGPGRPPPFVALWPRGTAKSTSAEVAVAKLGARRLRTYCLYVSHTQDQADDHVGTIGSILESPAMADHYPDMADVAVNKMGSSKGWRRNRLRTRSGFTVDALGLDKSRRGAKLEETRPDMMVLDDVDDTHASSRTVAKNIRTVTQALVPALQPNKVIMMAQNVVAPGSIADLIATGAVDMLGGAIQSGPFPAVDGMRAERRSRYDEVQRRPVTEWAILEGRSCWPARSLESWSDQLNDMGMDAFVIECQQDTSERPGAIWRKDEISRVDVDRVPELARVVVGVDPNKTGRSDDAGVVVVGVHVDAGGERTAYVLGDYSNLTAPSAWRDDAARAAIKHRAGAMVVETAGLGEHAILTLKGAPLLDGVPVAFYEAEAKLGKADRARPVWRLYTDGRVKHVGSLPYLERQMTSWEPDHDPVSPGALDALVHAVTHLLIDRRAAPNVGVVNGDRPEVRGGRGFGSWR